MPFGGSGSRRYDIPIDRNFTARELGFDKPTENSIDSVSDRDHMVEFTAAAAMCFMHLTRLSEELILFSAKTLNLLNFLMTSVQDPASCRRKRTLMWRKKCVVKVGECMEI